MNTLRQSKKAAIVAGLVEGNSIRSVERITGVHRDTICRFLLRIGSGCAETHDELMYGLRFRSMQVDEIWAYVGMKQKQLRWLQDPEFGDWYTFVAIDDDTKLVPSYRVARRLHSEAQEFITDLSYRVDTRIQLFSDAFHPYADCVEMAFGAEVDYAQVQKIYEEHPELRGRYSPGKYVKSEIKVLIGQPDEEDISTSYVERNNLTMRMSMRRFTRLTNAFSKTIAGLRAAVDLHFFHYNFCRIHGTTRSTPAMAAGVTDHVWEVEELLLCESSERALKARRCMLDKWRDSSGRR